MWEKAATLPKMSLKGISRSNVTTKRFQVTLVVFYKTTCQFLEVLFFSSRAKSYISGRRWFLYHRHIFSP